MKNIFKAARVGLMLMVCALFLGIGIKAEAAPGAVTGLKQTDDGMDQNYKYAVKMQWTGTSDTYLLEYCDKGTNFQGLTYGYIITRTNVAGLGGLNGGKSYDIRVSAVELDANGQVSALGTPSAVVEAVTAPSGTVTGLKQTKAEAKKIRLGWNKLSGANAYEIRYIKTTSSKQNTPKLTGDVNSYSLSVSANSKYGVAIYPARRSSNYVAYGANMSSMVIMSTTPPNKKIEKVKIIGGKGSAISSNAVDVSWKSVAAADGYEYQIYGNNNKKVCTGSISASKYQQEMKSYKNIRITNNKLKKAQFMKIKVRAYVKVGKKKSTGKWSDWVWFAKAPVIKSGKSGFKLVSNRAADGFKLSWNKVTGAKKYDVYVSRSMRTGYKKVASVSGTSCTVKKFKGSAITTGSYYFYVVANKKVGKKTIKSDYVYDGGTIYTTYSY